MLYNCRVPTLQPTTTKICRGEINSCAKFIEDRSVRPGRRYIGVKYNTFGAPFLSFFILAITYSLNVQTHFDSCWLKMSGLEQESAFCMFALFQIIIRVLSAKNYPRSTPDAEIPAKFWI